MFMIEYKDIGWWYWLVTAGLLTYGVLGEPIGFMLAIGPYCVSVISLRASRT